MVGKQVNKLADDILDRDQKKKFLMRSYPPSVEQMKDHHVEQNFNRYFPYLVYYHEPDLSGFLVEDKEVIEMRKYINTLFKENLFVKEEGAETYCVPSDLYDDMVDYNEKFCKEYESKLDKYEKFIFCGDSVFTLERLQSTNVKLNLERFLPFILRFSEPSLNKESKLRMGDDLPYIERYLKTVLYTHLDFA